MNELARVIGERIKETREQLQLTQAQFAEKLGVTSSLCTLWEKGVRKPSADVLLKIGENFGVSLDYLFFGSTPNKAVQNPDLVAVLEEYRKLSTRDRNTVKGLIELLNKA